MLMVRLSNGITLPKVVLDAFNKSNSKMLCAIHKSLEDGKLTWKELRTTEWDLNLTQTIIEKNGWISDGGEFAILDEGGIVYKSNGSNFELEFDENDYMHINGEELVVHSHKAGFIGGRSKEDVDRLYRKALGYGYYDKDERFGEDGFTSTKKEITTTDFAKADKEQKITSTDLAAMEEMNNKLFDILMDKGEKTE